MHVHKYVDKNGSAAMLAAKGSAGVAQKVNLRFFWRSTLTLKPRADITRNLKLVYVAPQKALMSSKKIKEGNPVLHSEKDVIPFNMI